MTDDEAPRAYLREWRTKLGLTQPVLGERTGDGKDQISRWENGKLKLKVEKAMELAVAMGLQPWQIFVDPEEATAVLTGRDAVLFNLFRRLPPEDRDLLEQQALRLLRSDR